MRGFFIARWLRAAMARHTSVHTYLFWNVIRRQLLLQNQMRSCEAQTNRQLSISKHNRGPHLSANHIDSGRTDSRGSTESNTYTTPWLSGRGYTPPPQSS